MASIEELRAESLKKIDALQQLGIEPYPVESNRTHEISEVITHFKNIEGTGENITIAGRIMSLRGQGGIVFADISDGSDKIQVVLKQDDMEKAAFDLLKETIDKGDIIEITGNAFTTNRGVESVSVKSWRILAKAIRPIPEAWYGLKDEDERFRRRYLDMLLNEDTIETIKRRSTFWNTIRGFMLERGFIEVETPVLEVLTGGAEARPFITHHNALDIDVFLRISVGELWQKKLAVGGLPKTFEIGRIFRNEGMSHEHANDYTSFEFYESYSDHRKGVPMLIELYRTVAKKTYGTFQFSINGHDVDLSKEWETLHFYELIENEYGIDPRSASLPDVKVKLDELNIVYEPAADLGRCVDLLWKKIRKSISGPAILTGMPVYMEPLAKRSPHDDRLVERFQIILAGSEVGKAFNELNDPIDQRGRFADQQALRDAGDDEAQMADFEYVEAMEYGMPPMFGFGVSERLFSFLEGKSIREAQTFPLMRPRSEQ